MGEKIKNWAEIYDFKVTYFCKVWNELYHFDVENDTIMRFDIEALERISGMKLHSIDRLNEGGLQIWLE